MTHSDLIYLDNNATTPLDPRVKEAMEPWLGARYGNPHARDHRAGREAASVIDVARQRIAALIGASPAEIYFTSGATEANNLALLGGARAMEGKTRLAVSAIEHSSILEPARHLEREGHGLVVLRVMRDGLLDMGDLGAALSDGVRFVSIGAANGEIGTIQPIGEIAKVIRRHDSLLHTDAAQLAGKQSISVEAFDADLISFSAHKFCGPMGIGALYVRRGTPLRPIMFGGGQQGGLRPGSLPVALIVGFGMAAEICRSQLTEEAGRIGALRDRMESRLRSEIPGLMTHGEPLSRLPGTLSITVADIEAENWLLAMPELCLSTASACASGEQRPSHVLKAIGLTNQEIAGTIRIGLGRFTTEEDVDRAVQIMVTALARIRAA